MDFTALLLNQALTLIQSFLYLQKEKLAKYSKWCIRGRDILLILFPVEMYPPVDTAASLKLKNAAVPVKVAEKVAAEKGFTIVTNK